MSAHRVQIISSTHPDEGTETTVFVDGKQALGVDVVDIDPGRGYDMEDYEERLARAKAAAEQPDATDFDRAVAETLEEYRSQFAKWATD